MIRPILTVFAGTLSSRVMGFIRDALVAALLGAGGVADAFLLAFQLVNVTRRLLSEGALNAALVPAWLRVRDHNGAMAAAAFAGRLLGSISVATFALAVFVGVFTPLLIAALAPGFAGQPALKLAVDDARLMLPYLAFAGPVAVMMGLLNARGEVKLTAFSPLLFNIALIAVTAALLAMPLEESLCALILSATVGVAGLLQLSVLSLRTSGERLASPLRVSFDGPMRAFFAKAVPGMVANSTPQLLVVAGAIAASSQASAVSWLYFANRLIELPLGLVGMAMGAVLLPEMSRAVRTDDRDAAAHAAAQGLVLAAGVALPAALALIVLRQPIVHLLFEHGAFDAKDTAATAQALGLLALGLPAQVVAKSVSAAFYAREDTRTPLVATLWAVLATLIAAVLLGAAFGAPGVAMAISLGGWCHAALLIARDPRGALARVAPDTRRRIALIVLASLLMGGLLWLKVSFAWPWVASAPIFVQAVALGALIAGGLFIYAALLVMFGVLRLAALRRPRGLRG